MKGIPKTVSIAGASIKIEVDDLSDDECFGYYSHDRRVIVLAKGLRGRKLLTTLRHEILEASLCLSGVGFCEAYEQEAVVRCVDEIFFPAWERIAKRLTK